ncbi:hypothetical protein [Streptomyces sp. UG1]|uniref:hypothetical protein n=1 Tax=Streptomyces sp. UG1 TaxID=3417652 RepID=UPI003CFADEE2
MSDDRVTPPIHALPDGEAEIAVVLRLPWEDVARLGQEAGRLAAQMQRPVTLDEAVSHRLRSAAHAKPATQQPSAVAAASVSALPPRPAAPAEQARQAIDRINGSA